MTASERDVFSAFMVIAFFAIISQPALARGSSRGTVSAVSTTATSSSKSTSSSHSACGATSCASALAQQNSSTNVTGTSVASPPFDAAAPPAPAAITQSSPSTLAPPDPVSTESGGSSRTETPGGGAPTLANCMSLWEPVLDMSKAEWKATCIRTLNGIDLPEPGTKVAHTGTQTTTGTQTSRRVAHHNRHRQVKNVVSAESEPEHE